MLPDRVGDLRGQPLLHLEAAGEAVKHPRELADPDHLVVRQVGDRRLADDRRHVVLAVRLERDVLQQHDLVIAADFLEGAAKMLRGIFLIAARIFPPRARDAPRRIEQAFAVGVVAGPADQRPDRFATSSGTPCRWRLDEIAVVGLAMS